MPSYFDPEELERRAEALGSLLPKEDCIRAAMLGEATALLEIAVEIMPLGTKRRADFVAAAGDWLARRRACRLAAIEAAS